MGSTLPRSLLPGLALALLLLLCGAEGAAAQEPPGFLVERIVVEGLERDAARQIVLSESLLHEGRTYSEAQLREAVYRVKRLPFVVDADMALRKGSERGSYELVITVEAAKPIAFSVEVDGYTQRASDYDFDDNQISWGGRGTLAARKFVGSRGLLFGSVQAADQSGYGQNVQLGYTRYGLFRAGGYATAALSSLVGSDYGSDNLQASFQLGAPVVGNQAVRAGVAWTRSESDTFVFIENPNDPVNPFQPVGPGTRRSDVGKVDLEWIFDTTDDPLLPTEGLRATTSASYTTVDESQRAQGSGLGFDSDSETWQLRSEGRRHWAVTPRQSLALRLAAWHTDNRYGYRDTHRGDVEDLLFVEGTHALDLWDFAKRRRVGDLRWENSVGVERFHESRTFDRARETTLLARSSLLFRNAWGLVRVSLTYVDLLGGER